MNPCVSVTLGVLTLFLFGFAVGCPLLVGLCGFPLRRHASAGIILSAPVGVLAYGFVVYAVSSALGLGLDKTCRPAFVVLALSAGLYFILSKTARTEVGDALSQATVPVLAVLALAPLSFVFVLLPMARNGWEMAYSIGNDGARYLMMIEYLQHDFWRYGKAAAETLTYPMGNRPVMHYISALPVTLFGVSPYLAYSMSASLAALSMAATALGLGFASVRLRPAQELVATTVVFLAFGLFGSFQTLYYTAFLGQLYAVIPMLVAMVTFSLAEVQWRRFTLWCAFVMLLNATVYSVGNLSIVLLLLVGGMLMMQGQTGLRRCIITIAILAACACVVVAVFRYEFSQVGSFLGSRNDAYNYGALNSILIMNGVVSKYMSYNDMPLYQKILLLLPICVLSSNVVCCGLRNKAARAILGAFLALGIAYVVLYLRGRYYLLNKISSFLLPLLLSAVPCAFKWHHEDGRASLRAGIGSVVVLTAVVGASAAGILMLTKFYEPIAVDRLTYITPAMAHDKEAMLKPGGQARIISSDLTLERTLLMRQLYAGFAWQPLYAPEVWQEYGIRKDPPPKEFGAYDYKYFVSGIDLVEVVDYASVNQQHLLHNYGDKVLVFDENASIVEFGPEWERKPFVPIGEGLPRRFKRDVAMNARQGTFAFVNRAKVSAKEIVILAEGRPVTFTVNGRSVAAKRIPTGGSQGERYLLQVGDLFGTRVNRVSIATEAPGFSISEVRF